MNFSIDTIQRHLLYGSIEKAAHIINESDVFLFCVLDEFLDWMTPKYYVFFKDIGINIICPNSFSDITTLTGMLTKNDSCFIIGQNANINSIKTILDDLIEQKINCIIISDQYNYDENEKITEIIVPDVFGTGSMTRGFLTQATIIYVMDLLIMYLHASHR